MVLRQQREKLRAEALPDPTPGLGQVLVRIAACGVREDCLTGRENLCPNARFTGYQIDGGDTECCHADARYCFPIPEGYGDLEAAPLLCASLIGYRALRMTDPGRRLGRGAAGTVRCGNHLRPVGSLVPAALAATAAGRVGLSSAPEST